MSTDVLEAPAPPAAPPRRKRRRRFRFSLNALAIQLSAFALSVTLVALLVVSGSQAAFVEESEAIQEYVPIGASQTPTSASPRRPAPPVEPAQDPGTPTPEPTTTTPPATPTSAPPMPSTVVALSDNARGTSMFGAETVLAPGTPSDRCIVVDFTGNTDPQPVRLYAAVASGDLAPYLDLVVDMGEAGSGAFGDCGSFTSTERLYSGTLADFAATHASWAGGIDTWDPDGERESRAFRFTVSVQDVAEAEGRSVRFGFSWETRARS